MDSTSVSITIKPGKNAGDLNDLYEEAIVYLVATIKKNTKHKSSKTVISDYLYDVTADGRGASTSKELTFVFKSPSSMCNVQMAVTEHWFELAIALATKELTALCNHHGYEMRPRKAGKPDMPFIPHGDGLLGVTKKTIVSDDGEVEPDELPKAIVALATKTAKSGTCQCAFCATIEAKKAVAPKWKAEKPKPRTKAGELPELQHFTSLAKAVRSPDRAGTCEVPAQGANPIVIPKDIGKLQRLTQLILNGYVTEIPPDLYTLAQLEWFCIAGCDVSEDLAKLTKLKILRIGSSSGNRYPDAIGALQNLQSLHLWFNKTKRVPASITQLSNLTSLRLEKLAELEEPLPPIGELSKLQHLGLIELRKPKALLKHVDFSKLKDLTRLEITYAPLAEFPATLHDLPKLEWLTLRNVGGGETWPDRLGFPALQRLEAPFNALTSWPKGLNGLASLTYVSFAQCKALANLDDLRDLPALENLELYSVAITHLPAKAPRLPSLKWLSLGGAEKLKTLPPWLAELPSLERLDVSSCWGLAAGEIDALKKRNPKLEVAT